MKLKLDESGNVVVQDGKPVYIHDDGKEIPFDAAASMAKISSLNAEAKGHRERAEKAEAALKVFDGLDAEKARKALETVKNFDDKKLIEAGEVEKVKAEAKKTFDEQLAKVVAEKEAIEKQYQHSTISGEFARSQVIKDKTILPADIMQSYFGKHFSVENGKVVAKFEDGNPIYSRINAGELASFDEALEMIIDKYPHKDSILKGSGASGTGANQPKGAGNTAGLKRSEMSAADKAKFVQEYGQEAFLKLPLK